MPTASNPSCFQEFPFGRVNFKASLTIVMGQGQQFISVVCNVWPTNDPQNVITSVELSPMGNGVYASSAVYPPPGTIAPWSYQFVITYSTGPGQSTTMLYPVPPGTCGGPPP